MLFLIKPLEEVSYHAIQCALYSFSCSDTRLPVDCQGFPGSARQYIFGIAETEPRVLNFDHDLSVREVLIKAGDKIKTGDTLAIFHRAELDENEFVRQRDMLANETERAAERAVLVKEREVVQAKLKVELRELALI